MSKYTTQLRYIVEANSTAGKSVDERITEAAPKIFNFSFPIWAESDRQHLEELIIQHYYMREIGFETVGQWKLRLRAKLREIMPYYNELWKTTQLEYPLFQNVDVWETYDSEKEGTFNLERSQTSAGESKDTETGSSSTSNSSASSDLPQVRLTTSTDLDYANTQTVGEGSSTSSSTVNGITSSKLSATDRNTHGDTEAAKRHRSGIEGGKTYTELVQEYRDALLQIPVMIIGELADLFMVLW